MSIEYPLPQSLQERLRSHAVTQLKPDIVIIAAWWYVGAENCLGEGRKLLTA